MPAFSVLFEIVNPVSHPEHYCPNCGEHPIREAQDVPEQDWTAVAARHGCEADAFDHFQGLVSLIQERELIRNVSIEPARDADVQEPPQDSPAEAVRE